MKNFILLALLFSGVNASASCAIYKDPIGMDGVAEVLGSKIYQGKGYFISLAHIQDGVITNDVQGGGLNPGEEFAHIIDNVVYKKAAGNDDAIAHVKGETVYAGKSSSDAVAYSTGCTEDEALAGAAAYLILLKE